MNGLLARWLLAGEWRIHPVRTAVAMGAIALGVALGFAGPAVFRIGDGDEVVDEEDRADVASVVQPVEPLRPVEAQVRGVEIDGSGGQAVGSARAKPSTPCGPGGVGAPENPSEEAGSPSRASAPRGRRRDGDRPDRPRPPDPRPSPPPPPRRSATLRPAPAPSGRGPSKRGRSARRPEPGRGGHRRGRPGRFRWGWRGGAA